MDSIPTFRVEVTNRLDTGTGLVEAAHQLGLTGLHACQTRQLYFLLGPLQPDQLHHLCRELLADPVTETYSVTEDDSALPAWKGIDNTVDVLLRPGVTDPAAENLMQRAHLLGIETLQQAATGQRYLLTGTLSTADLQRLVAEVFSNPVIQYHAIDEPIAAPFIPYAASDDTVEIIPLRHATDEQLVAISQERRLSLNLREMQAIRDYFQAADREPTDAELETLAQTWSEHCVHKTFKAEIDYTGPDGQQTIDGILNTYIRAATLKVNKPWVRSAFVDNAGIIAFDDRYDLAFKVETHNRPSAIEPFGGANTGVGGVIRDVMGVSARPIANTDVLCFGPPDLPHDALQPGVLHPRRIAAGVISGIEDYGNKMGIPTVNGAILYDHGYTSNPLVFCGCLGILPHGSHRTEAQPGDLIVVIGGRTGRDGLRGATFSSMEIDQTTGQVSGSAVQIGHPIHEKQALEAILRARDLGLYTAITDCGAGGLSSAVGEMGADIGARVQLQDVPLKYPGLRPWEIWLSEAQERLVLAVPPHNWEHIKALCDGQNIDAVAIGSFEPGGVLELYYGAKQVGHLPMDFLHDGLPRWQLQAEWQPPATPAPAAHTAADFDLKDTLLRLLAHPDIRSKEDVIRRYDHEVQGGTGVKPLVGPGANGPGDAAVIVPVTRDAGAPIKGAALANGVCPQYGITDPYAMAWAAIDEAFRNLVAVGADPDQVALLDNFCWGNTSLPDRLGSLVRCAQGCYDAALAYNAPYISGKDSLNNEYLGADGQRHAIPGTLLISALGIVPDIDKAITMDLKASGNLLYIIGSTRDELGGSHFNQLHGLSGGTVPQPVAQSLDVMRALHTAIQSGLVQSCHDVSEGGIAVALAEMCLAGSLGVEVFAARVRGDIDDPQQVHIDLFAESAGRFIVEVSPEDDMAFERLFAGKPCVSFGKVTPYDTLAVRYEVFDRQIIMNVALAEMEQAWRGHLPFASDHVTLPPPPAQPAAIHRAPTPRTTAPRVLILHANGTNRDHDAWLACELAGGDPEIVHVNQLVSGERRLLDYHMLVVPGGFSYGDDLGAGTLWALDLRHRLRADVTRFIDEGRPVLGICNGFQTLVKSGLLPGGGDERRVTLAPNAHGQFECRWVYLQANPHSPSLFTRDLDGPIYCPVAHGEGRVVTTNQAALDDLWQAGLAALTYIDDSGLPAGYPFNPNGSAYNIAGLTNPAGNVLGLMPHPENHIFDWQHPRARRGERGMLGLRLFQNGIKYA